LNDFFSPDFTRGLQSHKTVIVPLVLTVREKSHLHRLWWLNTYLDVDAARIAFLLS